MTFIYFFDRSIAKPEKIYKKIPSGNTEPLKGPKKTASLAFDRGTEKELDGWMDGWMDGQSFLDAQST